MFEDVGNEAGSIRDNHVMSDRELHTFSQTSQMNADGFSVFVSIYHQKPSFRPRLFHLFMSSGK